MSELRWYAFTTASMREGRAIDELARFTVDQRLPIGVKVVKRSNGTTRKRIWPLMVGYAFGAFASERALGEAVDFLSVAREERRPTSLKRIVASASGSPLELRRDRKGLSWEEAMDYSSVELPGGNARPLAWGQGDTVLVTDGALAGQILPVECVTGERARLVVELFNRTFSVEIGVTEAVLHKAAKRPPAYEIGATVNVLVGPFAGFSGVVDAIRDDGKLIVTVQIFGRHTPVDLDESQVAIAKGHLDGDSRRSS